MLALLSVKPARAYRSQVGPLLRAAGDVSVI